MFIRMLALFTVLFSFGQNAMAQCLDLSQVANCHAPVGQPILLIPSISQEMNENGVTTYTLMIPTGPSGKPEGKIFVADGKTRAFKAYTGEAEYTAICSDKTLTIDLDDMNHDRTLKLAFTQQQDNHVVMTMQIIKEGEASPVFEGFCR